MTTYQAASTVSRALYRDAGLRNAPTGKQGHHVRGGGSIPVSIYADVTDALDSRADRLAAEALAEHLAACGWQVKHDDNRVIVQHVPTAADRRKANT